MNPRLAAEIEQLRVEIARLDRLGFDSTNIKVRLRNLLIEAGAPLDVVNDLAGFHHMQYVRQSAPTAYVEPTEQDWWDALAANPGDRNTLGVFADWAQERNHPLAELLGHLRDHGKVGNEWRYGVDDLDDDWWTNTYHHYPHQYGWATKNNPHIDLGGDRRTSLYMAPLREHDGLHQVELSTLRRTDNGNIIGGVHRAIIPADLAHGTASRLAESGIRDGEAFRDHLAKAQQHRDAAPDKWNQQPYFAGSAPTQNSAQSADGQPLGYAHDGPLTLGPGGDRGHRTPKGETLTTHDIQDEHGNALGDIRLHPSGDDSLGVHWAGVNDMAAGEGRGDRQPLGPQHVRNLMGQIAAHYPAVRTLSYVPAAGRLAAGARRVIDLDGFRTPETRIGDRQKATTPEPPSEASPEWHRAYRQAFALFPDHEFAEAEANRAAGGQQYAAQYADGQPIQPPPAQDPAARVAQLQKWAEMWRQRGADPSHFLAEIARLTGQQGPPPPAGYQDADGRPLAYAATMYGPADDFHAMLSSPEHNATRWGHGDHNLRQVAADAYQEEGDEESANHLRNGGHVILTPDRRVVPGKWNLFGVAHAAHQAGGQIQAALGGEFNNPIGMIYGYPDLGGKPSQPEFHAHEYPNVEPDPEPEGGVYPPHTMRLTVDNDGDQPWGYRMHAHFHASEYPHRMAHALHQTMDGLGPDYELPELQDILDSVRNVPAEVQDQGDGIHYAKGRKFNRAPKGGASVPVPKQYRGGQFVPAHYAPPQEAEPAATQDAGGNPMEYANQWGGKTNTRGVEPMHETVARHGFDPETPREIIEDRVRDADGEHRADIFRVLHKARRAYLGAMEATPEAYHQHPMYSQTMHEIGSGLASGDIETPFQLAGHMASSVGAGNTPAAAAWRNVARAFGELQYLRDNHDAWRAEEDYNPPGGAPAPYRRRAESRWRPTPETVS